MLYLNILNQAKTPALIQGFVLHMQKNIFGKTMY